MKLPAGHLFDPLGVAAISDYRYLSAVWCRLALHEHIGARKACIAE